MVLLALAIITGSTIIAFIAIVTAVVGLLVLIRDWRQESETTETSEVNDPPADNGADALKPEMFAPDVSYEEAIDTADDTEDFDLEGEGTGGSEK